MEKYFLTAVFSLLAFSIPVKTQQPLVGLIQGRIVDQKQAPIPYATLTATNIDSVEPESHRKTTGTDDKGFYQFVDVPEGRYSIVVKKTGYRDYEIPVVTVRGGETVNMPEIKMSPAARR
ncbi:MAG TPA: carboxypeptidase-like regulatory domain-containing protein [Bryobacteraceae bacterium]